LPHACILDHAHLDVAFPELTNNLQTTPCLKADFKLYGSARGHAPR
jgi:hypothetical protein